MSIGEDICKALVADSGIDYEDVHKLLPALRKGERFPADHRWKSGARRVRSSEAALLTSLAVLGTPTKWIDNAISGFNRLDLSDCQAFAAVKYGEVATEDNPAKFLKDCGKAMGGLWRDHTFSDLVTAMIEDHRDELDPFKTKFAMQESKFRIYYTPKFKVWRASAYLGLCDRPYYQQGLEPRRAVFHYSPESWTGYTTERCVDFELSVLRSVCATLWNADRERERI